MNNSVRHDGGWENWFHVEECVGNTAAIIGSFRNVRIQHEQIICASFLGPNKLNTSSEVLLTLKASSWFVGASIDLMFPRFSLFPTLPITISSIISFSDSLLWSGNVVYSSFVVEADIACIIVVVVLWTPTESETIRCIHKIAGSTEFWIILWMMNSCQQSRCCEKNSKL